MQNFKDLFNFISNLESTLIHKGDARVSINDAEYKGEGKVKLDLYPRPCVHVYGSFNVPSEIDMIGLRNLGCSKFTFDDFPVDGFQVDSKMDATDNIIVKWTPKSEPIYYFGDTTTEISYIVFHLFNFENFSGNCHIIEELDGKSIRIPCLDLKSDVWHVKIKSLNSTEENVKYLRNNGGYRLTHVGLLRKIDGTTFKGKIAKNILNSLRYFLSFAKGTWCPPVCPVGFDSSNNCV